MLERIDLRERRERLEPRLLENSPSVSDAVRAILARVRDEGDDALLDLTLRFDGADLRSTGLVVEPDELAAAAGELPDELRRAIDALVERLTDLHRRQLPAEWRDERGGVRFGEVVRPLAAAGCYVPGGRARYPSSVAMTVTPARVAGVPEVIVCTPSGPDGSLDPAVRYAAAAAGATAVVKVGGAQAIGAMAFGTASVPAVERIVGPGNEYVTEAKRQVAGIVGIDGLAGPTELVVVADGSIDPRWVALDLIAQAEHAPDALATFMTTDERVVGRVEEALRVELPQAARREIVEASLAAARTVLVADTEHAVQVVNDLAPEHLQLAIDDPAPFLDAVRNAGAIFVGAPTAVPFGDYGVASNHVLPTAGTARFASGLRATDFVKVMSVVEMDPTAVAALAPEVAKLARAEGLDGHARAVEVRAAEGSGRP